MMTAVQRFDEAMANNDLALRMSDRGWAIDQERRKWHSDYLAKKIEEAKQKFVETSGVKLDVLDAEGNEDDQAFDERIFGSAKQLKELFFNQWGVKPKYFSKQTGAASLDRSMLKDLLAEGVTSQIRDSARWLLQFREAHKTKATYVDRLGPDHLKSYLSKHDFLLRPRWGVCQAQTGRWSCADPNLQNLQKPVLNDKKEIIRPGTRDMLIAKPGMTLMEADEGALELRIIALLAGDEILLECFEEDWRLRRRGETFDLHKENARVLFGHKRLEDVTKQEREAAKTFVYGSNYGGSVKTIWKQMVVKFPNMKESDVQRMHDKWFETHYWLRAWVQGRVREAREIGRVIEYLSGRPFIFYLRQVKPTEPGNYLVQGFAAALMNRATIRIDRALRWDMGEGLLAQIHDAAVVEGPAGCEARMAKILRDSMEEEIEIDGRRMKFVVDCKAGNSLGTMKEWKDGTNKVAA